MEAEAAVKDGIPMVGGKPAYTVYTNKNGVQFKVINFDNPAVCPNKGIVEYRAFKEKNFDSRRETNFTCPIVKDHTNDIYYGIFNGFHNNGDPKWINFPLHMINTYDRSIPTEAKKALIMSKSYLTEGSPFAVPRLVKFRLHDKEKAANDLIKKITDAKRALAHAEGLAGQKLLDMALNLGMNTLNSSVTMITAEVLERAQNDPIGYLKVAENPNIEVISILNKAIDTKVVENDTHKGYTYKGAPLGHNFDFAIDFLLKNREILAIIDMASKDALEQGRKASLVPEKAEDSSAEIAELRRKLAESEAKNKQLSETPSFINTNTDTATYNPLQSELNDLLVIAKEKKMKGLHLYKPNETSIAKLKQAIAEKK